MRYIFLDIETTNEKLDFEIDKSELIEVWAYDFENKKEFSCCIKINHKLSEFTKRLTGINDIDIEKWKNEEMAIKDLIKFLWDSKDLIIVGHNIEWFDIPILKKYSEYFENIKYLDTLHLFLLLYPWLEAYNVEYLYKYFINKSYKEEHRALQDAKDEAELFFKVFDPKYVTNFRKKESKNIDFLSILWKLNENIKSKNKKFLSWLNQKKWKTFRNDFMKNNYIFDYISENFIFDTDLEEYSKNKRISKEKIFNTFFRKFDYLSLKKKEYNYDEIKVTNEDEIMEIYRESLWKKTERPQQVKIIKDINHMLNWHKDKKISWIEAWTWTWKTYWYLIPSMNFLQKNPNNKIFIATYTKVLQNQILKEDIEDLSKKFNQVKYTQLKANSEWFDLNNIPLISENMSLYHIMLWLWIQWGNYYISDLHYWIVKNLNHFENTNYIYNYYNQKQKNDHNSSFGFKGCLLENIHTKNLFVVNHNFFISQFWWYTKDTWITWYVEPLDKQVNFKYHIIFDEWHNLETVMRDYFTTSYDIKTFEKIVNFIIPWGNGVNVFDIIQEEVNYTNKQIESILQQKNDNWLINEYIKIKENNQKSINEIINKINDKDLLDYVDSFLDSLIDSDVYRVSKIEIRKLREKYSLDTIYFNQSDLFRLYFIDANNKFQKIINKLYDAISIIYSQYKSYDKEIWEFYKKIEEKKNNSQALNQTQNIWKYLRQWKDFLWSFNSVENFIEWFVDFNEWIESIKNFGFKMLPKELSKHTSFINKSEWVVLLSATLYDSTWEQSYILTEISWEEWFESISPIKAPFNYEKNRIISVPNLNIDYESDEFFNKKAEIVLEYVKKYWGKTLILTTNNKDKDKIANYLYEKLNWEWIMVKKHEWWSMNSRSNQQNIQSLKNNPETVLIWSKSYMEWVDIPWENLSLVILRKLPFLPPTPFIEYQNNKPTYRKINNNYVYKFFCWILFRQAIWRLIRTETDKGEILILDPRINDQVWWFFKEYL